MKSDPLLEDDMARIDAAGDAVEEMQALAMRLARRPQMQAEDIAQLVAWALKIDQALHSAKRMAQMLRSWQTLPLARLIERPAKMMETLKLIEQRHPFLFNDYAEMRELKRLAEEQNAK